MYTFKTLNEKDHWQVQPRLSKFLYVLLLMFVAHVSKGQLDTINMKAPAPKEMNESPIPKENKEEKVAHAPNDSTFYVEPGSYGTKRIPTPPEYVKPLNKTGINGVDKIDWLEVGLDHRTRYEYRQDDIRRSRLTTDNPFLFKTRVYLGIKNIIDPFRFGVEVQNSGRLNSKFPKKGDDRDYNYIEPISLFAELHFKKLLGKDRLGNNRPVFVRFGRQNFEFLDRRLIGANQWRNTTNTFNGFRAGIGQDKNDWSIDILAVRPLVRLIDKLDSTDNSRDFGALIGHWRRWSEYITIEPYLIYLRQRPETLNLNNSRRIFNPGLRIYGWLNKNVNYDVSYNQQFGKDNSNQTQRAYAVTAEVGYKFAYGWKPRFSLFYGYASGDRNPNDDVNNRFERFFGFARPWSADDYIVMENIVAPKARVELEPNKIFKIDIGYSFFWLASATDRLNNLMNVPTNPNAKNRDRTGQSGNYVGHGPDGRIRFTVLKFIETAIGYSHFFNGNFVMNRQDTAFKRHDDGSNFFYVETTLNVFDIFKIGK